MASSLGVVAVAAAAFVIGMRTKSPLVLGVLVWLAKHVFNGAQMRTAGQPGAYAGIIRARGRVSGRMIETPVGIVTTETGFLIALPYGPRPQWLQNVIAAGEATLVHEGATYAVDRPELIETRSVAERFSPTDQRLFRLLAVDECLRLRPAATEGSRRLGSACAVHGAACRTDVHPGPGTAADPTHGRRGRPTTAPSRRQRRALASSPGGNPKGQCTRMTTPSDFRPTP